MFTAGLELARLDFMRAQHTNEFAGQMCAVQIMNAKVVPELQSGQQLPARRFF
jgi:hypothetical protein